MIAEVHVLYTIQARLNEAENGDSTSVLPPGHCDNNQTTYINTYNYCMKISNYCCCCDEQYSPHEAATINATASIPHC